jgi:cell division protein FtsA
MRRYKDGRRHKDGRGRPKSGRQRRQRGGYVAVVDPGTTTLRLLVVEVRDDQAVVWGWDEQPGGSEVLPLAGALERALARAEEMAQDRAGRWLLADQMVVGLPASHLRGGAWPVVQRRSRPDRPVEEQELAALMSRGLRLAVNRLADPGGAGWHLVDVAAVTLSVAEHRVTDPVGFRGREIGATVFAALARAETIAAWRQVAQEFEFSALILAAAPLALAAGLAEPQGILLDVGGATTDLTWWQAGRPVALASLPLGGADLTRSLLYKWPMSADKAEELKATYAAGRLSAESRADLLAVMAPALRSWLEATETALAGLDQDESLPPLLYLLGGGSALPEMAEAVRSLAWSRRLHFARYPQVGRLQPTNVPGVLNRTDRGRAPGDVTALALAAWTAAQQQPAGRPARILGELCRGED